MKMMKRSFLRALVFGKRDGMVRLGLLKAQAERA